MQAEAPVKHAPSLTVQASWLLIAKVIAFALSIAGPLVIVRFLNQSEFGLYKQSVLVLTSGMQLLTAGFYLTLFYYLPRRPHDGPKFISNVILLHTVAGLAGATVILLFPALLQKLANGDIRQYSQLLAPAFLLTTVSYCLEVIATANQDVKYSATFIILANFSKGVAAVAVAMINPSLTAILWAMIIQAIIQCFVLMWYLRHRFGSILQRPDWDIIREQMVYFFPFAIAYYSFLVQTTFHQFAVANRFSAAEYAIYAVGCSNLPLIGVLRESINAVLIPRISYLQQQGDTRQVIALLGNAARKLSLFYLPVFAFLFVVPEQFLAFVYTPRFLASKPILLLNLFTLLFLVPIDPVIRGYERHRIFAVSVRIGVTVLMVPAVFLGIQWLGMVGAFVAVIVAMFTEYLILLAKSAQTLAATRQDLVVFSPLAKVALAAFLAAVAAAVVKLFVLDLKPVFTLMITGTVFWVTYAAIVIGTRIPTEEETTMVYGKLLQLRRALRVI